MPSEFADRDSDIWRSQVLWVAVMLVCCFIALLNTGGYRFGVSDQSSYLPAIQKQLEPELFPRDRSLIDAQDRVNPFTRVAAAAVRLTGADPSLLAFALYIFALVVLFGAALGLARELDLSRWATIGLGAALTLRHRILLTGVNTLESYAHPRMMAFALGLTAVLAFLRARSWLAVVLVGLAFLTHPTTALWFGVWLWVAFLVADRRWRWTLLLAAAVAAAGAVWVVSLGPLRGQLIRMDQEWLRVLAGKDYLFATDWPLSQWVVAELYLALVVGVFLWRLSSYRSHPRETALVAGALALFLIFLVTLPFVKEAVTLAIQFQISRMFWMLDLLATIYAAWAVFDGLPLKRKTGARPRWPAFVALALACAALGRGLYSMWVRHPERPMFQLNLPRDDWQDAMAWLGRTPVSTHVLADPGHLWRYGTSVRVSARRDVYLEEVKDVGMAIYSRSAALRISERTRALGDFGALTPQSARALAARYDLDYLVTEKTMDLPAAYRNPRFTIYRLR
jgi:hypothetical protein